MSTGATFELFEKELNRLVASFGGRLAELKKSSYVEAQLRDDFLNPFFRALGWDMENRASCSIARATSSSVTSTSSESCTLLTETASIQCWPNHDRCYETVGR